MIIDGLQHGMSLSIRRIVYRTMHATARPQRQTNVKGLPIRELRAPLGRPTGAARKRIRRYRMEIAEWKERPATVAG
jgi:DNA-directed RNA polymerase specialized sigma24 family protein